MKLGDFMDQIVKIWETLIKIGKIWLIFRKMRFSQNYAGTNSIHKNEARKLKFGLEVPLYVFCKCLEQVFEFLTFFENLPKILDKIGAMSEILDIIMRHSPKRKRFCLTVNLQSWITFSPGKIASSRKKRLFSDKNYFHMSPTCKNDPGPPLSP